MMRTVIHNGVSGLELAGLLSGVPYVGAAAIVLRDIVNSCEEVRIFRRKAKRMANRCVRLLLVLNDQQSRLEGSELQAAADEVTLVLEAIRTRLKRWSRYNRVTCYVKRSEIEDGLDQCESELSTTMEMFHINAQMAAYHFHRESSDVLRNDNAETRELLYQILSDRAELRNVIEMHGAGENVAEPIMAAGQNELRLLRSTGSQSQELLIATTRSASPPPSESLSSPPLPPPSFEPSQEQRYLECQRGLMMIHRNTGIPPSVKVLDGEITKVGDLAIAGGTYSDIWLGQWLEDEKVALKALRNVKANNPKAQKRFEHEVTVWSHLQNDHILPFYGIVTNLGQHIHMVSPWQENGNVLEYLKSFPDANRIHLLSGAARGIEYLHSRNVIHGNVKCANILVTKSREACICDFGMSKVIEEVTEKSASATLTASGSARWLAPELIEGAISTPTPSADIYSYAMAILELLTGKHPFSHRKRDASVIHDIVVLRKTPPRPADQEVRAWLTDDMWALMQECWCRDANARPSMTRIATRMEEIERNNEATTPTLATIDVF